jgi:hypothetical protein
MPNINLQLEQPPTTSVVGSTVRFVAPALQLDLTKVIWSHNTTFFDLWSSSGRLWSIVCLIAVGKYICPVPRCGGEASTKWNFRRHFLDCHPQDLVYLPSKGPVPLPRCERCGMQTERGALLGRHQRTQLCREGWDKKVQHEATETTRVALTQSFTAYGDKLERVEVFKYLGQLLAYDNNDTQAMQGNLKKARKSWGRVSRILRAENASP